MTGAHDRAAAWALLCELTQSESLRKHALAVEAAMRHMARLRAPDEEEAWGITGLLHDFDYEKYPNVPDHPLEGSKILEARGWPEPIRRAILGHAPYTGVPRDTEMARVLFAVDELAGFITAVTYVRPNKSVHEVEVKSVKKKLKAKAFAASVNRDEIAQGAEELGIPLDEIIAHLIEALRTEADAIGIAGTAPA